MKPLTHALIAEKRYGGTWNEWLPYHHWFDQSKAICASMQHRMFLHSDLGIAWFEQHFGKQITVAGTTHTSQSIAHDHLIEDLGFVPRVEDWIAQLPAVPTGRIPTALRTLRDDPAAACVARWGGVLADYAPVLDFFASPLRFTDDPRALALSHNAFGIFLLEQLVGPALRAGARLIPTRTIGEDLVLARYGHIPYPSRLSRYHLTPWMRGARVAAALSSREDLP